MARMASRASRTVAEVLGTAVAATRERMAGVRIGGVTLGRNKPGTNDCSPWDNLKLCVLAGRSLLEHAPNLSASPRQHLCLTTVIHTYTAPYHRYR
jgi:hypothetical protein